MLILIVVNKGEYQEEDEMLLEPICHVLKHYEEVVFELNNVNYKIEFYLYDHI